MILVPDLEDIDRAADSQAERRVARLLHEVDGPVDAVAFHSVSLRFHRYKQHAEADFVILWKGLVIVVEVKGGGVRKHDGAWYSVDRHDKWHKLSESPMKQATSAMHALKDILNEDGIGWYATDAIVVTPDIAAPPSSPEWDPRQWLSKADMSVAALTTALNAVVDRPRRQQSGHKTLARTDDLRARLFGEFTRMPALNALHGTVIEEQNRATAQQARFLAGLASNPRVILTGGAGTGKSLALVEAAKLEASTDRTVLITFGSPALSDYFDGLTEGRAIDVIPFDQLPDEANYDAVFIDEAQDLMTAERMDRLDRIVVGGRAAGRWRLFLDLNNQAHVDGAFDPDMYELVAGEAISFALHDNVRNTRAIVQTVQDYLGADLGDARIVHGDRVRWHWSGGIGNVDVAAKVARRLIADGVRRDNLWIISTISDAPHTSNRDGVTVTSPRHAKGLEADHVVVCDLPEVFDDAAIARLYVALTRARVTLDVVATDDDKRRLQALLRRRWDSR